MNVWRRWRRSSGGSQRSWCSSWLSGMSWTLRKRWRTASSQHSSMYRTDRRSTGSCWRRRRSLKVEPGRRRATWRRRSDQWVLYCFTFFVTILRFFFSTFCLHFLLYLLSNKLYFPRIFSHLWSPLSSYVSPLYFLPPQRFSMEGISSVIQNSFRQTFGSGRSERQVYFVVLSPLLNFIFLFSALKIHTFTGISSHRTFISAIPVFMLVYSIWPQSSPMRKRDTLRRLRTSRSWLRVCFFICTSSSWILVAVIDPFTPLFLLPCSPTSYERRQWQGAQSLNRLYSQRWAFPLFLNLFLFG